MIRFSNRYTSVFIISFFLILQEILWEVQKGGKNVKYYFIVWFNFQCVDNYILFNN